MYYQLLNGYDLLKNNCHFLILIFFFFGLLDGEGFCDLPISCFLSLDLPTVVALKHPA